MGQRSFLTTELIPTDFISSSLAFRRNGDCERFVDIKRGRNKLIKIINISLLKNHNGES